MARNTTPLKVVGKADEKNKSAALDAALSQIDRAFGKGAVMKLGQKNSMDVEAVSTGNLQVKRLYPYTVWQKFRNKVVLRLLWMLNMRLILFMRVSSVLM